MEKTAQFSVESVDSLVERFRANGLETINLGLLCFRFAPALKEMNLISVLTAILPDGILIFMRGLYSIW